MDFGVETDAVSFTSAFFEIKRKRQAVALFLISLIYAIHYLLFVNVLSFSPISPIYSISAIMDLYLGHPLFLIAGCTLTMFAAGALYFILSQCIFSASYEKIINLFRLPNFYALCAFFTANIFEAFIIAQSSVDPPSWFSSRAFIVLWLLSMLYSSFYSAYFSNFTLDVYEAYFIPIEVKNSFHAFVKTNFKVVVEKIVNSTLIFGVAWASTLLLCILSGYLRPLTLDLFAFWKFVSIVFLIFTQQLVAWLGIILYNFYVASPVFYDLPSYHIYSASLRDSKSILAGLSCSDPLIRQNALFSLYYLASSAEGRKKFYSLSQPGQQPRCWKNMVQISVHYIGNCQIVLEGAARRLDSKPFGGNASTISNCTTMTTTDIGGGDSQLRKRNVFEKKEEFFLPPNLRGLNYECFGYQHGNKPAQQQQSSVALRWMGSFVTSHPLVDETLSKLFASTPLFTTYDARCTEFVIRALAFVVACSLQEDQYGVVQKDLRTIISLLTGLSATIDAYVRASKLGGVRNCDANVFALDSALVAAIKEIYVQFRRVIGELNLPPNEAEILEMLANSQ